MPESNYNNDCAFSEQTISYIYGEIGAHEKIAFENHLENCSMCADEIDGFGSARSAVALWKKNEFETLNTPKIAFSDVQSQKTIQTNVSAVEKQSWLFSLQTLFQPRMVLSGGLAAFLILGGLVFFTLNPAVNNQTAAISDKDGKKEINNSATGTKQSEIAETHIIKPDSLQDSALKPTSNDNSKFGIQSTKSIAAKGEKSAPVYADKNFTTTNKKAEVAALPQNKITVRRNSGAANSLVSGRAANNKKRIPQLNDVEIDDDEETSLRLTDLLDEVGGK